MSASVFPLQSVAELEARLQAERAGEPYLLFHDAEGRQQIVALPPVGDEVVLGRHPDRGIRLDWDLEVSRIHALLERVGGAWTVVDDGLSRNGTFLNGIRVLGRRRLKDRDALRCGGVVLEFHDPAASTANDTLKADPEGLAGHVLSEAQRRVLVALCRPLRDALYGPPATNKQIAAELTLSVDAVKTHLRRVSELLQVDHLPQNEKRATLALKALRTGVVTPRDLHPDG